MSKTKRVTLEDVAAYCNLSVATVSRVLGNADYPVSKSTKEKVLAASEHLGYYPNLLSRSLRTSNSRDIGVILPNVSNHYYNQLINGVLDTAMSLDYNITLSSSYRNSITEKKNLLLMMQKQVAGVLIAPIDHQYAGLSQYLDQGGHAVVLEEDCNLSCGKVLFDYRKGIELALEHLFHLGHRRIAYFSTPLRLTSRSTRMDAYRYIMASKQLLREDYVFMTMEESDKTLNYEVSNGRLLAEQFLKRFPVASERPTAVMCLNDMTAIGAMGYFLEKGLHIPEDISVMGFDNISVSEIVTPQLTTVDQCIYQIGSMALSMLVGQIENDQDSFASILLQPTVIQRRSTGPISG